MPKIYRAKALDTGEWVYGGHIFFAGGKPTIMIEDDDTQELIAIDIATSSHSVDAYDVDNIQLFTHDLVYVKHTSGTAFFAEVLEIAGKIYLRDTETGKRIIHSVEYSLKLQDSLYALDKKDPFPF